MRTLLNKILRRLKMTVEKFRSDCNFSVYYAFLRIIDELGGRIGFKKLSQKAHTKKENWALDYLRTTLNDVIDFYKNDSDNGVFGENAPIWVCWWTGEETAPDLVKKCIQSINKHSNGRVVNFIDKNTYSQYIKVPDYMLSKAESGEMGLAHLCDYIRASLLAEYGGLWLDATIYCNADIPKDYFDIPFFTCRSEEWPECPYLSKLRWTTFVLGGWKNNLFYRYLKSVFETYWSKEKSAIDYLFFDYLIELAYREIPAIKQLIDNVPINNLHRDDLQAAMNLALTADEFDNVVQPDTVLYKLSWRETYSETTPDGKESIYSYFLNREV